MKLYRSSCQPILDQNAVCPGVVVVSQEFGAPSQVWVERQMRGFRKFRPHLLYWRSGLYREKAAEGLSTTEIGTWAAPVMRNDWRRWVDRAVNFSSGNSLAVYGKSRRQIVSLIQEIAPQVILAHFGHTALYLLPVARRLGLPLVVHFHGLDLSSSLSRNRWYRSSLQASLKKFSAAVVVGEHQRRLVGEMGFPEDRLHLIPCGVPVSDFPMRPQVLNKPFRFVAVARLEKLKGFDVTLEAFAKVVLEEPETELHIVGDGPERNFLVENTERFGISRKVVYHGYQPAPAVAEILRSCDAFVQHSLNFDGAVEGFGVSAAEAASSGLAIIVSDCGGLRDQVLDGTTGFIVPQRDSQAMARAMLRLIGDPRMTLQMGKAARLHMQKNYDTQRQVKLLEMVLDSVTASAA